MKIGPEDAIIINHETIIKEVHKAGLTVASNTITRLDSLLRALQPYIIGGKIRIAGKIRKHREQVPRIVVQAPGTSFRLYHIEKYAAANVLENPKRPYIIDYWINILGSKVFGLGKKPLLGIQIKLTIDGSIIIKTEMGMHYNESILDLSAIFEGWVGRRFDQRGDRSRFGDARIAVALNLLEKSVQVIPALLESEFQGRISDNFIIKNREPGYRIIMPGEGKLM